MANAHASRDRNDRNRYPFANEIRAAREAQSRSQAWLVREVKRVAAEEGERNCGVDTTAVSRWESGAVTPQPNSVRWIARALGLDIWFLSALSVQQRDQKTASIRKERPGAPGPTLRDPMISSVLMSFPRTDRERLARIANPSGTVDDRLLDDLDALTGSYAKLRDGISPAVLLMPVTDHRDALLTLLPRAQGSARVGRVKRAAAQAATIAGWLEFNLRHFGQALAQWKLAEALAQDAADTDLQAYAIGCQSRLHSRVHCSDQLVDPRTAVALFDRAISFTSEASNSALRSWLFVNRAEQLADVGDDRSCHRDIDTAIRVIGTPGRADETFWSRWTIARLDGYRGNCERLLNKPAIAIDIMEDSLKRIDSRFPGRALQLSDLAAAYAEQGEIEQACWLLAESFITARQAGFMEGIARIIRVRSLKLADCNDAAAVRQLDGQLDMSR